VRVGLITTGGHTSGRRPVGRGCGRLAGRAYRLRRVI